MLENILHGFGVYRFANGHRYHEGRRQGYGMYTFRNGDTQSGYWDNGVLTLSTSQDTSQAGSSSTTISHAKVLKAEARRIAEKAVALADLDERVNRAVTAANRAANAARVVAVKAVQNRMHDRPLEIFYDPHVFIWENSVSLEVQGGGASWNHNQVRISKPTD
ncbi:membrane occupation and recognition nexus repeat-containing protein [Tanacetum coccineum]